MVNKKKGFFFSTLNDTYNLFLLWKGKKESIDYKVFIQKKNDSPIIIAWLSCKAKHYKSMILFDAFSHSG